MPRIKLTKSGAYSWIMLIVSVPRTVPDREQVLINVSWTEFYFLTAKVILGSSSEISNWRSYAIFWSLTLTVGFCQVFSHKVFAPETSRTNQLDTEITQIRTQLVSLFQTKDKLFLFRQINHIQFTVIISTTNTMWLANKKHLTLVYLVYPLCTNFW